MLLHEDNEHRSKSGTESLALRRFAHQYENIIDNKFQNIFLYIK